MINARAEGLLEKRTYKGLLARKRALVVADSFYEWRVREHDGAKEPVRFTVGDGQPFAFAGLWTARVDEQSGETLRSCTIITTRANSLVAAVHDRMPVILRPELEQAWLDPEISVEHALALLEPYPAELMQAAAASTRVNSVRNDDPSLLKPDNAGLLDAA
jgi:putative SOS response-associated peptidase YedK